MLIVAIAWIYVVLMMAVAEAMSSQGSILGAVFTFLLYGVLPLSVVLYVMATPARRRRRAAESHPPDGGRQPPGDAVAPEREDA